LAAIVIFLKACISASQEVWYALTGEAAERIFQFGLGGVQLGHW
jgi:hypothetical protein